MPEHACVAVEWKQQTGKACGESERQGHVRRRSRVSRLGIEFREGIEISKRQNAAATFRLTSLLTLMILAFFCACTAHGAWRVSIERGQCAHVKRQGNRAVWRLQAGRVLRASYVCAAGPVLTRSTAYSVIAHSRVSDYVRALTPSPPGHDS